MAEAPPAAAISDEEVSALLEKNGTDAVRPYDFTAQRINRMQLPLLEVVSRSFAERAGTSLSVLLSRDASMQFHSLESAKSADLQAALPVPSSLAVVRLKPLPGFAFISVEANLLLTLLDGFFGGTGRATTDPQAVIAPAAQRFLDALQSMQDYVGTSYRVSQITLGGLAALRRGRDRPDLLRRHVHRAVSATADGRRPLLACHPATRSLGQRTGRRPPHRGGRPGPARVDHARPGLGERRRRRARHKGPPFPRPAGD